MKTFKTKVSSVNKYADKYEIINSLYRYGINLENVKFSIEENHSDAYGQGQWQVISVSNKFYEENISLINSYISNI